MKIQNTTVAGITKMYDIMKGSVNSLPDVGEYVTFEDEITIVDNIIPISHIAQVIVKTPFQIELQYLDYTFYLTQKEYELYGGRIL